MVSPKRLMDGEGVGEAAHPWSAHASRELRDGLPFAAPARQLFGERDGRRVASHPQQLQKGGLARRPLPADAADQLLDGREEGG